MTREHGHDSDVAQRRGQRDEFIGTALTDAELEQVNAAGGGIRVGSDGANN